MRVEPLSEILGVELVDFDLTNPASPEMQAELRQLFCDHHLLLVRGQEISAEDQSRFVGNFGPLHMRADGMKETYVSNRDVGGRPVGSGTAALLWHNDGTYGLRPGIATSLWGEEVEGGTVPTMFANGIRVLEQMPLELRSRIESLHAVHLRDTLQERTDVRNRIENIPADAPVERYVRHDQPLVYRMPHVDRDTLLVSEFMTSHIVEMPRDEGEALLQDLFARLYAPANVYTHHWQTNDMIIWDNLSLQHCRPAEMGLPTRRLRRQSIDGWYTDDGLLDWQETVVTYKTA